MSFILLQKRKQCATFFCSTINFFALIFLDFVLGVLNKIKEMTYWNEIRYSYVYMKLIRMCEQIEWLVSVTSLSTFLYVSIHTNELFGFKLFPKHWQQSPNRIHLLKQSRVACSKLCTEVYSERPNNQSVNIHFRWVWFVIKPFLSLAFKNHSYCLCNLALLSPFYYFCRKSNQISNKNVKK